MKYKYEILSCGEIVSVVGDYISMSDGFLYVYHSDTECEKSTGLKIQAIFKQWDYITTREYLNNEK